MVTLLIRYTYLADKLSEPTSLSWMCLKAFWTLKPWTVSYCRNTADNFDFGHSIAITLEVAAGCCWTNCCNTVFSRITTSTSVSIILPIFHNLCIYYAVLILNKRVNLKEDYTPKKDPHVPLPYTFSISLLDWPKTASLQTSIFIHGFCSKWPSPCYKPFPYSTYWVEYSPIIPLTWTVSFCVKQFVYYIKQPENYSKAQKLQNLFQL